MNMQLEIIKAIVELCGKVYEMAPFGWYFVYKGLHFFYMPGKDSCFLRFTIPHLAKSSDYDNQMVFNVVNETNREVKFVKVIILKNGSISLSYDYILTVSDSIEKIIPHIIKTLAFASDYIMNKIDNCLSQKTNDAKRN